MKSEAIIVAAGQGKRMGGKIDKIFLEVAGTPIIVHTWRRFEAIDDIQKIIFVIRAGLEDDFRALINQYGLKKPFQLVEGGKERQDSVWNGLSALSPECEIVTIQDGARPCTPTEIIKKAMLIALENGAAVLAQKVTDTIKISSDGNSVDKTLDRSLLWAVQTPQVFKPQVIKKAIRAAIDKGVKLTDDTAACELIGQKVFLVECPMPNPKATTPSDLPYIEMILNRS